MSNNDNMLFGNASLFQQMTNNKTERELKLESVVYANKAPLKPNSECRWMAFGEIPARLTGEPSRINLDLSSGIIFTSEFWPTIKNQALELDHEPRVLTWAK